MPDPRRRRTFEVSGSDAESAARHRFAALVARPELPLAEAALAIAEEEYPGLDAARYLGELDALGREVGARAQRHDAATMLRAMHAVLFERYGLRGNADSYYDPRNSFLNEVLDRRVGIPITLSIVYLEVAARAGFEVEGVAWPGHFLVRHVAKERPVFIDAFRGGELLSADEVVARTRVGDANPAAMPPAEPRRIVARLLHNLKRIYAKAGDDARALWVIDRLLLLFPDDATERRDHGLVAARLGGATAAVADLEAYLTAAPTASDAEEVRALLSQLRTTGRGGVN